MSNKKLTFTIKVKNNEIIMTKKFHEASCIYGSDEYKYLREIQTAHPNATITYKSKGKKTYKRLTFKAMEKYICVRTNNDPECLAEFEETKKEATAKNNAYPATKKWFLDTYPEYKESFLTETEVKEISERAKETAKTYKFPKAVNQ